MYFFSELIAKNESILSSIGSQLMGLKTKKIGQ